MKNTLDKLYDRREQLKDLIKWSSRYGGKISLNNEKITTEDLKRWLSEVNVEIASIVSNARLRQIK
ncbi:MAG: hypothetical protein KGZ85_07810 [Ignavibacterium sp.]|nr:hypothetical protein [Ignavibacterium sp.]